MLKPSALAIRPARFSRWIALAAAAPALLAQQYAISTVAGGAPPTTPATATASSIGQPRRVTTDSKGNIYFSSGNSVFKMSGATLSLVAGNSRPGFSGDGGPAVSAMLYSPQGLAVDGAGNIYIADTNNNRVRIVTTNGIINTFAGNGLIGSPLAFGDGGPANQANLQLPGGVAVDSAGNLYIADTGDNLIRKVTTDGVINTIAGDSLPAYAGDGGPAVNAEVHSPEDVAVDSSGNVYIADTANAYIREITVSTGIINFIAGDGSVGYSGDGGLATSAGLIEPFAVCVDSSGNVYITEPEDGRIREVTHSNGIINTIVGNGVLGFSGDGGAATKAMIKQSSGIALNSSGTLYIADTLNNRIRNVVNGTINTIGGNGVFSYSGDGGPAIAAQLFASQGVAVDAAGNFFIADTGNNVVREVTAKGIISTIAGNGTAGYGGDNGPATAAELNTPQGIAVDTSGNVYVSDTANARVRKISNGTITTVAGNGTVGYSGDGGSATSAMLNTPVGLALDKAGNLYIVDHGNNVVREVSGGVISTIAGNGTQGFSGNGGPATAAQLNGPQGVAVDATGDVYIADTLNNMIREVTPGGIINTFAGNGIAGFAGDGGFATVAELASPSGVAVDTQNNVYIADSGSRIRKVYATSIITTIAGNGVHGYSGDGGLATSAMLSNPNGISTDSQGDVYIADTANNAIRQLVVSGSNLSIAAVTNGASNQTGSIAPGEVLVIYGTAIGAAQLTPYQLTSGGLVSTTLAGTTVYMNGAPSPILYTSPNQVSAIVPFGITSSAAQIFIVNQGQSTEPVSVKLAPTAPAVFTLNASGIGQAAAYNQDGSVNGASNPAKAGALVTFFITGAGATNPPSQDGMLAAVPLPQPLATTLVAIGGKNATVQYSGGSQGTVDGIIQVNAVIPTGLTAGNVTLIVQVANAASQGNVTIAVSGN